MADTTGRALDQKAELDGSYSRNGESIYSRASARMRRKLKDAPARPKSIRTLIEEQERGLRALYAEHKTLSESDPRIIRVRRDIDAKQAFVGRLWAELGAQMKKGRA